MGNQIKIYTLSAILCAIGLSIFLYKHFELYIPLVPHASVTAWTIDAQVDFRVDANLPPNVELVLPGQTPNFRILDETFASPGYGTAESSSSGNRVLTWSKRRARGEQSLLYRAVIVSRDGEAPLDADDVLPATVPEYPEHFRYTALALLDETRAQSADIQSFTVQLLHRLFQKPMREDTKFLMDGTRNVVDKTERTVYILAGARIPARILLGLPLKESSTHEKLVPLLQVHNGDAWLTFNPQTGEQGLPENFFVWSVGNSDVLDTQHVYRPRVTYSVTSNIYDADYVLAQERDLTSNVLERISLTTLPVDLQNVYRLLLLVPLGALVIVVLRNIVGLSTTGTFSPALVALSFRETGFLAGVLLFVGVVGIGLTMRLYLEKLQLLVVPRIAAVVCIVIMMIMVLSLVSHGAGFQIGLSVALFPIVI
ncbi:MAG: UUP1 family membrane protein, partial [Parvibaculum sp.]